jgi:regulator of protease activity HflC (stomatin/prohibitin superfamily)
LDEGIHLITPGVNSVVLMETRTQKEESTATAASRDLQVVTANMALNFRIQPDAVGKLYQRVGTEYKIRIIDPTLQESVKVVTARYTAEDLIRSRASVKAEVENEITKRLAQYYIQVEPGGLSITNFDFSPEFAQQEAEKQKYLLQRAELEKQTEVTRAEGKAQAARLSAESLKVQGGSLVIAREWIEKWDGKLPQMSGGSGQYIVDVSSLLRQGGQ